jgi:outer membrane protein
LDYLNLQETSDIRLRRLICTRLFFVQPFIIIFALLLTVGNVFCTQSETTLSEDRIITLEQAIELALQNNRSLKQSELNVASSKLAVETTEYEFNIRVRPATAINFSSEDQFWIGGLEVAKKNKLGITTSLTPKIERNGDEYNSSVEVSLSVPLLNGFGTDYNLDPFYSSVYNFENTQRSHYQQQVNIVLDTISTVYEIIKNQQQAHLLNTQINALERHISLTKIKEKTGLATAMDLYRAEIRLKEVQNELTPIYELLENNIDRLTDLLARPIHGGMTVTAPVEYKPAITHFHEEDAVTIALVNRIEIEQSERRVEELRRKMILEKNNILPQIDLGMGYGKFGDNNHFDLTEDNWVISLNGPTDLFRSEEKAAFEQAKISLSQSKINLESQKQSIVREVRAQINQMKKKKKLIGDRLEQARQAQGKLELAISKFNHGLADNFDLIESQTQTQQVQSSLLFDKIGYIVDTYRLRKVLGTLIDRKVKK